MNQITKKLFCDYLVIGAGASPLAFIDTLLSELPETKVIMIDKKAAPGGHWVDSYDFVRLHQPSIVYGVASKQLEGNWLKLMATKLTLPWNHRATKQELLSYFGSFVDEKVKSGQLEFYPNCVYNFEGESSDSIHHFSSNDGTIKYEVQVNHKLVNGVAGECMIPSQNPLQFPVDEGVNVLTPNQVYQAYVEGKADSRSGNKYVVLGAGKTAMDSIVYLQRTVKVKPDDIAWVIPNDVWMLRLTGEGNPWSWPKKMLKHNGDIDKVCQDLESSGAFTRLDPNIKPTKFRFPVMPDDELKLLRRIKTIIRRGKATAIRRNDTKIEVEFGDQMAWEAFAPAEKCVFIHATSPGPFNGKDVDELFTSDRSMTLNLLTAPPVSSSMSTLAKLEAARRKGTLDLDFARKMMLTWEGAPESYINDCNHNENDLLRFAIKGFKLSDNETKMQIIPIVTFAMVLAILDKDPTVGINWMKGNRLSFLSIPNFKCNIYEDISLLCEKGKLVGFDEKDIRVFELLAEKLKPLDGM